MGKPDYDELPDITYDWTRSIYGEVKQKLPNDFPVPKGPYVTLNHYVGDNLYHDSVTGKSVTGVINFINHKPV